MTRKIIKIAVVDDTYGIYVDSELGAVHLALRFEKEYMSLAGDNAKQSSAKENDRVKRCNSNYENKK